MTALLDPPTMTEPVAVTKLTRDLKQAAAGLGREEIGSLVDLFYRLQEHRIALGNQAGALIRDDRPADTINHFADNLGILERQVVGPLQHWCESSESGRWALAVIGIGPVLAARTISFIDVDIANTAGKVWSFFGLNPTAKWNKGERRPWCAEAKTTAWKIGDSFVKSSGHPDAYFGKLYRSRKELEVARNLDGVHADLCARELEERGARMSTDQRKAYEQGRLPDGRIDLRARRVPVKLFLALLHHVMFEEKFGVLPPAPYPIEFLGHADRVWPRDVIRQS